jgi:hypothetical protein
MQQRHKVGSWLAELNDLRGKGHQLTAYDEANCRYYGFLTERGDHHYFAEELLHGMLSSVPEEQREEVRKTLVDHESRRVLIEGK